MGMIRRSREDYAQALLDLLPPGLPFPREPGTVLHRLLLGLAGASELIDGRVADLLEREADPRATIEMLEDWERNAGLPDPCVAEPLSIEDRRRALVERLTAEGRQDRQYFIDLAARLGYSIEIREHLPYMAGVSQAGGWTDGAGAAGWQRWRAGPPEMRFVWSVKVSGVRVSWFRAASGQAGVDPHVRIAIATDLECILRRYKPAHTNLVFDYSEATPNA